MTHLAKWVELIRVNQPKCLPLIGGELPLFTSCLEEVFSETRMQPVVSLCVRTGPKPLSSWSYKHSVSYKERPYATPITILIAVNAMVNTEVSTSTHPMARSGRLCATRSWSSPSTVTPRLKTIAPIPQFPDTSA
jgi:hypothetical protein